MAIMDLSYMIILRNTLSYHTTLTYDLFFFLQRCQVPTQPYFNKSKRKQIIPITLNHTSTAQLKNKVKTTPRHN